MTTPDDRYRVRQDGSRISEALWQVAKDYGFTDRLAPDEQSRGGTVAHGARLRARCRRSAGKAGSMTTPDAPVPLSTENLKDEVRKLAFLTPEDWDERRGGDPIARTINAVFDIIDEAATRAVSVAEYPGAPGGVHDHGPHQGPGTSCPEYLIGGCRAAPVAEVERLREALAVKPYDWLDEYSGAKGWEEAMDIIRAALSPAGRHDGEQHQFRTSCLRCGERGMLHVSLITTDETVTIGPAPR